MGIILGNTIEGRETYNDGSWSERRLTLLWLGESVAVWQQSGRKSFIAEMQDWQPMEESGNWNLNGREWFKRSNSKLTDPAI
jgi:hypothetical protein